MPLIVKDTSEDTFTKIPLPASGTVQAVCCAIWDLGYQKTIYMGDEKIQHKVVIAWEIAETINAPESEYHGKPFMLNKKYTMSLSEKANLRKDLESWRGAPFTADELRGGFDILKLYGVNCLLGVKHVPDRSDSSKLYANVSALLPIPKGMAKIQPVRKADAEPPKWVLDKILEAVHAPAVAKPAPQVPGEVDLSVPPEEDDPFPVLGIDTKPV